jgi:hypothetical protein
VDTVSSDSNGKEFRAAGFQSSASSNQLPGIPGLKTHLSTSHAEISSRSSIEPIENFDDGQHIGPTSGLAFMHHAYKHGKNEKATAELIKSDYTSPPSASIFSSGDMPLPTSPPVVLRLPTREEAATMVELYFTFAMPTYRFFHRPTLESWMKDLFDSFEPSQSRETTSSAPKAAAVFLVWAQALEYYKDESRKLHDASFEDRERRYVKYRWASFQLGMCLFLLVGPTPRKPRSFSIMSLVHRGWKVCKPGWLCVSICSALPASTSAGIVSAARL